MTGPQLLVLHCIQRAGTTKPSVIAKEIRLSQATVTTILDRLERSGFVRRDRSTVDRRVVRLELTAIGVEKLQTAPELLQAGFFEKFSQLKDWEQALLISALQRIAYLMDADDIDAAAILELGDISNPGPDGGKEP